MQHGIGQSFAEALARKDPAALRALLRPDVDFRAMTPSRFWESKDADEVVDEILLGKWFEPSDEIRELVDVDVDSIGPRARVGYRFRVQNPDGRYVVEQQAYFEADDERISWLRVICSGFLPDVASTA